MVYLANIVSLDQLYKIASKEDIFETIRCIKDWEHDNRICILDYLIGEGDIPDRLYTKVTPSLVHNVYRYDPYSIRPYAFLEISIKAIELFMENDSMNCNMGSFTGQYHCWCQKFLLYRRKGAYRFSANLVAANK